MQVSYGKYNGVFDLNNEIKTSCRFEQQTLKEYQEAIVQKCNIKDNYELSKKMGLE